MLSSYFVGWNERMVVGKEIFRDNATSLCFFFFFLYFYCHFIYNIPVTSPSLHFNL
ncbi:hypothetical protein HanRHA438_Chr01g0027541 [Helianthus annuus]|nr:hypothetical protein HanRHA438_Chr01g0027541 [Helianthus annuus]